MNRFTTSLLLVCCFTAMLSTSCDKFSASDDISGISLRSVDVFVEYTTAKVFGEVGVLDRPERISEIRVYYGTASDALNSSVRAAFDTENGFSADITSLEDGAQFFYRVDIIVGKTPITGTVQSFITFPKGPVDLDLPSGKKWASHNVGAKIPTERGDHFAWGETSTKGQYSWSTYKYCSGGDFHKLTKYVVYKAYAASGVPDNLVTLQEADDAATANMGKEWRTPTQLEWQELIDFGVIKSVNINGIQGVTISSKKDMNNNKKFIFIPGYIGRISGTQLEESGHHYWTATLNGGTAYNPCARTITAPVSGTDFYTNTYSDRCDGLGIRAITK